MDPLITPITGRYNEDILKNAYLGKPSVSIHYTHVRHPRPHDPSQEHLKDYADMLHDHHHDIPNTARYALKGAVLGAFFGLSIASLMRKTNNIALRKFSYFIKENTFGVFP